ncbi:unnamed protein product [Adineta steineri]|uniref:SGNH hydrolase-type esterase domain-containing protein n=3 Tax=Adineta steineri TaxID=433720 RepID=A0A813PNI2_9BILA|nr:unnamed protein product [Adineta steineri]CAF0757828.1 unnamed protein product [Adineta steineri]CAF3749480.1 unnamed protein product [Adineta steineri]
MSSASPHIVQLTNTQLDDLINQRARFKQRSHDTHTQTHQPQLESPTLTTSSVLLSSQYLPQIDIILLGSSMLERFKTTGKDSRIGQMQYPQLFNAGVGGDKIENVLYRINLGLLRLLKLRNPKVFVLYLGGNNIQPKQALTHQNLDDYYLLLQALLMTWPTPPQILVTGLFKQKKVDEQYITQSNTALEELVVKTNIAEMQKHAQQDHWVHWMEPPKQIGLKYLQDDVHLNTDGYQIWDDALYPKIQELLHLHNSR